MTVGSGRVQFSICAGEMTAALTKTGDRLGRGHVLRGRKTFELKLHLPPGDLHQSLRGPAVGGIFRLVNHDSNHRRFAEPEKWGITRMLIFMACLFPGLIPAKHSRIAMILGQ
jgi:hypothetical protein